MANVTIAKAVNLGGDLLEVHGEVDGKAVSARGWMSAMTNHYDADDYEELDQAAAKKRKCAPGRHLRKGATPREMSEAEKRSYMEALLVGAAAGPKEVPIPGAR